MSSADDGTSSPGLAASRSRRERKGKAGRLEALAKLKEARQGGNKFNYEVDEVKNVYDIVDEREYAEQVLDRQNDDWIVDDDGMYVEDGREIFDEDMEDIGAMKAKASGGKGEKKKPRVKNPNASSTSEESSSAPKSGNIKNMFLNMPTKRKKEADVKLEDDEVLGELLGEVASSKPVLKRKVTVLKPKTSNTTASPGSVVSNTGPINPFRKSTGIRKPKEEVKIEEESIKSEVPPSQTIEDFEEMEEAVPDLEDDEDMIIDDASQAAEEKENVEESKLPNRGFQEKTETKPKLDLSGWTASAATAESANVSIADVHVDASQLPMTKNADGDQVLRMYWLDAHDDPYKHPGTVWLFGKVYIESAKTFVSCCLTVKNIQRRIFLLKRDERFDLKSKQVLSGEEVSMQDVYQEFNDRISTRYKIQEHKSRPATKRYAFECPDVPPEGEYLEVIYSAKFPILPSDLTGETFSRVFGANQSSLESFLLARKIKGPGWLDIKLAKPSSPPMSWCKVEAVCENPNFVSITQSPPPTPPVTILALNMKTTINPKTHQNEITLLSCLVHPEFYLDRAAPKPAFKMHFCALTKPADEVWPFDFQKVLGQHNSSDAGTKIEKMETERALLGFALAKIGKIDPDVIIGHDISGFDIDVLMHRLIVNKIPHWSKMGRLRRSQEVKRNSRMFDRNAVTGRLVCDLKLSAKELIRCKSYDLGPLIEKLLGKPVESRFELDCDEMRKAYTNSKSLLNTAGISLQDAADTLQCICDLNALPLALQITQVAGNVMSRTLLGGRAERNEYLLLHAFTEKDFIVPDKSYGGAKKVIEDDSMETTATKSKAGKRKPAYAGGLVLEPKKGFYDKFILLMDFNSLYPSIIQEYNICFTTVNRQRPEGCAEEDFIPELPDSGSEPGVLPTEIRKLVESRRAVKALLKDHSLSHDQKMQYDIRQKALKLTANSMYGCLGFSFSRFYAKPLAALVTSRGREILMQTKTLIEKMNLEVIYGDTDSIMINSNSTDFDEVYKLGGQIKQAINKLYKLLELDIDGVFQYMLLLKKKKYAAVTMERNPKTGKLVTNTELKGLDIVRRDWSQLAADAGKYILSRILTEATPDERIARIHEHLESLAKDLKEGKVALADLAITKQLTKDPMDYPDKKSLPHVQVAIRLNSKGGRRFRGGDTVPYVICDDGTALPATQRAYHVDEVRDNPDLKVDTAYYLAQQLHPVVGRLCDPLEGTDSAMIAQCLGLDPEHYRRTVRTETANEEVHVREEDRFRLCEKLEITCGCGAKLVLDSVVRGSGRDAHFSLIKCSDPKCQRSPLIEKTAFIQNKVTLAIRNHIKRYYAGWVVCEDPGCSGRTRQLPLTFQRAFPVCSTCGKATMYAEYTDSQLYTLLLYYQHIFDVQKAIDRFDPSAPEKNNLKMDLSSVAGSRAAYAALKQTVDKMMNVNNYSIVSLNKVFEGLFPMTAARFRNQHTN